MLLPIRTLGDPVLREPAKPVEHFDRTLRRLAKDMIETMYDAPGVGLAGPQVGMSLQLFVFDDGERGPSFLANPELYDGDGEVDRGGGVPVDPRARTTRRRGTARSVAGAWICTGNPIEVQGEGLLARIFQHETDHLQRHAVHRSPRRRRAPRRARGAPPDRARARRAAPAQAAVGRARASATILRR